jgi:DNA-binding beta-propeller fold protein YncE
LDGDWNIIVADHNCIRKITQQGQVSSLAGTGDQEGGYRDEAGILAQFDEPSGVAVDGEGNVVVADSLNNCIRKITPQGQVSTLAGTVGQGYRDGEGTVALFSEPCGVAVDGDGSILVADSLNNCIRKITPQGQVSTLAGIGERGHRDRDETVAQFAQPY